MSTALSEDIKRFDYDADIIPSPKASKPTARQIQNKIDWVMAPIKTAEALNDLIYKDSPLDQLSLEARQRFVDNITFNENGITSFKYSDLEAELTPTKIYKLLSLFGIQRYTSSLRNARVKTTTDLLITTNAVSKDFLMGYRCSSPGTCIYPSSIKMQDLTPENYH